MFRETRKRSDRSKKSEVSNSGEGLHVNSSQLLFAFSFSPIANCVVSGLTEGTSGPKCVLPLSMKMTLTLTTVGVSLHYCVRLVSLNSQLQSPRQPFVERCSLAGNRLLAALKGMYRQIQRRFKIGAFVGESFTSTNGILQGCSLSVMLLNALMLVLTRILEDHVQTTSFVDDLTLMSNDKKQLQKGLDVLAEFMHDTQQQVNEKKTKAFKLKGELSLHYKDRELANASEVKVLGVPFKFVQGSFLLEVPEIKVESAITMASRIRFSGMPFHLRALLNGMLVMSKIMYGIEVQDLSTESERRLRTAVSYSVWCKTSKERSVGLLLTLPVKGHVLDPAQAPHVRRWTSFQRLLSTSPEIAQTLYHLYHRKKRHRRYRRGGLVDNLLYSEKRISLNIHSQEDAVALSVNDVDGDSCTVVDIRPGDWAHWVRELARRMVWTSVDKERAREGRERWKISEGIDRAKTLSLYHKSDARKKGILRKIFLNAVWTQARRAHMPDNHDGPLCVCGTDNETLTHLWWECPRWTDVRSRYGCALLPYTSWSPALRDLGICTLEDRADVPRIQNMMVDIFCERYREVA